MAVVIDEVVTEAPAPAAEDRTPAVAPAREPARDLERLSYRLAQRAQRDARLWAD